MREPTVQGEAEPRPPLGRELRGAADPGPLLGDLPLDQENCADPARAAQKVPEHRGGQGEGDVADHGRPAGRCVPQDVAFGDAHVRTDPAAEISRADGVDLDPLERAAEPAQWHRDRTLPGPPLDEGAGGLTGEVDDPRDGATVGEEVLPELVRTGTAGRDKVAPWLGRSRAARSAARRDAEWRRECEVVSDPRRYRRRIRTIIVMLLPTGRT